MQPAMLPYLDERCAEVLKWPLRDVRSFSKPMLREILEGHFKATKDPNAEYLAAEVMHGIRVGRFLLCEEEYPDDV